MLLLVFSCHNLYHAAWEKSKFQKNLCLRTYVKEKIIAYDLREFGAAYPKTAGVSFPNDRFCNIPEA